MTLKERLIPGAVILAGLAAHTTQMGRSLWLDEAWVANCIQSPSLRQMFYFERWVQTTPPLFLFLSRLWTSVFGNGEVAMRTVSWLAAAACVILMAMILQKVFGSALSLLGVTFLVTNYYAGKYAQQVKQYSTDMLAGVILLVVIWIWMESDGRKPSLWAVTLAGVSCLLLSYTTAFWLPSLILAVLLPWPKETAGGPAAASGPGTWRWKPAVAIAVLLGGAAVAAYVVFVLPNRPPRLYINPDVRFLGSDNFLYSFVEFADNVCQLMLPQVNRAAAAVSWLLGALVLLGALACGVRAARGERRARTVFLAAVLPVVTGMGMSLAHQYPLLDYPRYIIWMLPFCVMMILYALEPLWLRLNGAARGWLESVPAQALLGVLCLAVVAGFNLLQHRVQEKWENVRGAMEYMRANSQPNDTVYVQGGVNEPFEYYRQLLGWSPQNIYWGTTEWPCCARNVELRVTNPKARQMEEEMDQLAAGSGGRIWFLLPGVEDGRWSTGLRELFLNTLPSHMKAAGWNTSEIRTLPGVLVIVVERGSPAPASAKP